MKKNGWADEKLYVPLLERTTWINNALRGDIETWIQYTDCSWFAACVLVLKCGYRMRVDVLPFYILILQFFIIMVSIYCASLFLQYLMCHMDLLHSRDYSVIIFCSCFFIVFLVVDVILFSTHLCSSLIVMQLLS